MANSKIWFSIITVLCLCFLVAGCGNSQDPEVMTTTTTTAQTTIESTVVENTTDEVAQTAEATQVQAQTTAGKTQVVYNYDYTNYSKYIGKTLAKIKDQFGTNYTTTDCQSTMLYKYSSVGFHFDNFDEITDDMVVRMVRVYGDNAIAKFMKANMSYSELQRAVGDKTSVTAPEKYSDTEYTVQIVYKSIAYTFFYDSNPAKSSCNAKFVDVSTND